MPRRIRLGTRGSKLALWQAEHVKRLLQDRDPQNPCELVVIETSGDAVRDLPLSQIGGQGAFTKEIQRAVLDRRVDAAVHSLKDLPTEPVTGLVLAGVPARGPTGDAFVSLKYERFDQLPAGATVATGSLRRRAQLLHRRPDLRLVEIRGNVDTRLKKLEKSGLDALILAEAGLVRLGLESRIAERLDPTWFLPAVGQGAIGLECREEDGETYQALQSITDQRDYACVLAERAMLRALGGGCHVPIGAICVHREGDILLRGAVLSADGSERIEEALAGSPSDAEQLGMSLAAKLIAQGAHRLLEVS